VSSIRVIVEADGGARGNPGPAGYGAVVVDPKTDQVLAERQGAIGIATNNVAEYSGLIAGLSAAAELGADEVEVRMDSKLVVEQMAGRWKIKHPGLRPLAAKAAALVQNFSSVRFTWIPRERNRRADALANAAMDSITAPEEPSPAVVALPAPVAVAGSRSWDPPGGAATRLILARHGATELTEQRRYSGRGDVPLSSRGVTQARAVAGRLGRMGTPVTTVLTSPLVRCVGTAKILAEALGGASVRHEADLVECDFGQWEGLTFSEVRERWPDESSAWLASVTAAPPGGESFVAVSTRVRRAVAGILEEYSGQTVVVVSHVSPIKLILRDALAAGDTFLHRCYLDPAGLSIVDTWPDGGVAVRTVNDTSHLVTAG
jgi:ribonuclease H / adenosylcobalamin/alpha-ribazole phosphatase